MWPCARNIWSLANMDRFSQPGGPDLIYSAWNLPKLRQKSKFFSLCLLKQSYLWCINSQIHDSCFRKTNCRIGYLLLHQPRKNIKYGKWFPCHPHKTLMYYSSREVGKKCYFITFLIGPRQANLVLIAYASSDGSGEPAHPRSLARTSAARSYKQWVMRNLQTESQIPGPSEWLSMRS